MGVVKVISSTLQSMTLLLLLIFGWEFFARFVFPRFEPMASLLLPPPSAGVADAVLLLKYGELGRDVLASMQRVYIGTGLAVLVGVPLGIAMGLSSSVYAQLRPLVESLRPIPPIAWIPITLLWFGTTNLQQYFIIFVGTIFPIILNTVAGVTSIDPVLKRAALCLGASPKAMFKLMLHGAAPGIFVGIRTSLAFGWFIIVASEMVSASSGLGFIINEARTAMVTERLYVGMFMIGMIGFVQDRLLLLIKEKLLPWV